MSTSRPTHEAAIHYIYYVPQHYVHSTVSAHNDCCLFIHLPIIVNLIYRISCLRLIHHMICDATGDHENRTCIYFKLMCAHMSVLWCYVWMMYDVE